MRTDTLIQRQIEVKYDDERKIVHFVWKVDGLTIYEHYETGGREFYDRVSNTIMGIFKELPKRSIKYEKA